jgi:hypothetical protein
LALPGTIKKYSRVTPFDYSKFRDARAVVVEESKNAIKRVIFPE